MGKATRIRWFCTLGTLPVLVLAFVAWLFWPIEQSASAAGSQASSSAEAALTAVEAVAVKRSALSLRAEATGYLEPWRAVELSFEVSGKLIARHVEEGQWVDAGEVLLAVDDQERRIELAEAEAELLKTRADYAVQFSDEPDDEASAVIVQRVRPAVPGAAEAARTYQDAQALYEEGVIPRAELVRAQRRHGVVHLLGGSQRAEVRAATTGLAQNEQRVERNRLALARSRLVAPFAGRIADLEVEAGQQLTAGQGCLRLLDTSRMKVDVDVLESDVVRLRPGAAAQIRVPALDDAIFAGTVHTINPQIDPETGTARVTIAIANTGGTLLPGLFSFARLETQRLAARLVVPADAVLSRQGRDLVFRLEDGRALWTYVELGARSGELVEIVDGLAEDDLVAVAGHFALAHETPVTISPAGAEPPAGGAPWNG